MIFKKCSLNTLNYLESLNSNSNNTKLYLKENFENLPEWIISKLTNSLKSELSNLGVNLKSAITIPFPPGNLTRSLLEDPNKVWFFSIPQGSRYYSLYIPDIKSTDSNLYVNGRYRQLSKLGVKTLGELANKVAYVDLTDPASSSREIRTSRRNQAYNTKDIDRDTARKNAQYPMQVNKVYAKDSQGYNDYDKLLSYDIQWVTKKGYDKSGYPLNPDKYLKILNTVGLDNYAIRLERFYTQLEIMRIDLVNLMNQFTLDNSTNFRTSGFSRSIFNDIGSAIRDFSDLVSDYQRLKSDVDSTIKRYANSPEEEINEEITYVFKYDGARLSSSIRDLQKTIKRLKNPTPLNNID